MTRASYTHKHLLSTLAPPTPLHHSNNGVNGTLSDHEYAFKNSQTESSFPRTRISSNIELQSPIPTTTTEPVTEVAKPGRPLQFGFHQIASQWWLWELLACFGSLLGLIAILVFLKVYIASFGALLTVLAFAIDPTVQQMVKIQARTTNVTAMAHLGRAQSYLSYADGESLELESLPTTEMVGAIYNGMFFGSGDAQGSSLDISPSCLTGNCTFPTFQSLAVCSTCEDVTYAIKRTCHNGTYEENWGDPNTRVTEQLYCELSLPNGLKVNDSHGTDTGGRFASSGNLPPVAQHKIGSIILNFSRVLADVNRKPVADQCSLYWCVNTYQSRVRNGRTDEIITHSWHDNTTIYSGSTQYLNARRLDFVPPMTSEQYLSNPTFTVAYLAMQGLSSWLAEKATTSNSQAIFVDDGSLSSRPDDSSNSSSSSPDMLRVLRDSDPTTLFANVAKSMTRNVRSVNSSKQTMNSDQDRTMGAIAGVGPANGTTQELQVYVSVHWSWLTLSALLVAGAIFLLALTVADTARKDISGWKSSPLPLLLQALQKTTSDTSGPVRGITDMERLASNIVVKLRGPDGGLERVEYRNPHK